MVEHENESLEMDLTESCTFCKGGRSSSE